MDKKGLKSLYGHVDGMDLEKPDIILLSGNDPDIMEGVLEKIKKRLDKERGNFELFSFSGVPGDEMLFYEEIFNAPLFSPYRLIILRQARELFKNISKEQSARLQTEMEKLPDNTLIVIYYSGEPPASFVKIFNKRIFHHTSKEIYSNQLPVFILETAHRLNISLTEEALHELRERVEPREGAISLALHRLKDILPKEKHHNIGISEVREIVFLNTGMNSFNLVDSLFSGDRMDSERELSHYNEHSDNIFGLLKLILNRTDEIRKFRSGKEMRMNNEEMIVHLGLKNRPPFIQKKILERLSRESRTFVSSRLTDIYNFLIDVQKEYKSQVPQKEHMKVFQIKMQEVFLQKET